MAIPISLKLKRKKYLQEKISRDLYKMLRVIFEDDSYIEEVKIQEACNNQAKEIVTKYL